MTSADHAGTSGPWLAHHQIAVPLDAAVAYEHMVKVQAATGRLPHVLERSITLPAHVELDEVVPTDGSIVSTVVGDLGRAVLIAGPGLLASLARTGTWLNALVATDTTARRDAMDRLLAELRKSDDEAEVAVSVTFLHGGDRRTCVVRPVAARAWSTIRMNYSNAVADVVDRLAEIRAPRGRLMFVHGPPGTGKTTMLLSLARAWRNWCGFEFVVDAETLLHGQQLLDLTLDGSDGDWRAVVIEDAGELLRTGRGGTVHPALGRLLNLTDGALGHGLRTIVCITTNDPAVDVHPALRRAGRCLADLHVGPLSAAEASRLLLPESEARGPMTLVEVLERRGDLSTYSVPEPSGRHGVYL